jgi:ferredoxin-NADP reductase
VRLLSNERATPTARIIRVALDGEPFRYRAGQSASLAAADREGWTPYSLASAPGETERDGAIEFLIKVEGSSGFGAIVGGLGPGSAIRVEGPAGNFTLSDALPTTPLLFIAGGTGIAPLRSMIRDAVDARHAAPLALVYSARTPGEFAYLQELRGLAEDGRLALTLTLTGEAEDWEHARGRTGPGHLSDLVTPETMAYICGPPAMVKDVPAALASIGLSRARIRTEDW